MIDLFEETAIEQWQLDLLDDPDFRREVEEAAEELIAAGRPPEDWRDWLFQLMPELFSIPFADHHEFFWRWASEMTPNERPRPFVGIWPRDGGKSTNIEAAVIYLASREIRSYFWYICETQAQADDHVASIAEILESDHVHLHYPLISKPKVGKYGNPSGWRRNRLIAPGLIIDALGLNKAGRGFKRGKQRPDCIIIDDVEDEHDTPETTRKKIEKLTRKLIPAGANNLAIMAIQNLPNDHGIFAQLSDGRAKFLQTRIVSGPHPAIIDLKTENVDGRDIITGGLPTWEGLGIEECQGIIDDVGLDAFKLEHNHDRSTVSRFTFNPDHWSGDRNRYDHQNAAALLGTAIGRYQFWDTALKDKKTTDYSACVTVDLLKDYRIALREVWQQKIDSNYLPEIMQEKAIDWNHDGRLTAVVIEDKGSGTTSIQTLRAGAKAWLANIIQPFAPVGTKVYRARNASMWGPRDCILIPYENADLDWYEDFLNEKTGQLFRFPNSAHDDMVDAFVMAILFLEHYISQGWYARHEEAADLRQQRKPRRHNRIQKALTAARHEEEY